MTITTFLLIFALAGSTMVQTMGPFDNESTCIINKERLTKTFRKVQAECFPLTNTIQQAQPQTTQPTNGAPK